MEQMNIYTVPELKVLAQRYHLDPTGTKSQLRMRISVWVRDEIANGCTDMGLVDDNESQPITEVDKIDDSSLLNEDVEPLLPNKKIVEDDIIDKESDDNSDGSSDNCSATSTSSEEDELELIGEHSDTKFSFRSSIPSHQNTGDARATADHFCDHAEDDFVDQADDKSKTTSLLYSTLKKLFGYTEFRDGQEWAIHRCLNHQRSLLVAPTGFGKSLCYTLPAAMMDGLCIVVSPLLSLIQDQIRMLPARLAAATLSGSMSTASVAATLDDIVRGRLKLLFVSPERLTSSSFRRLFRPAWNATSKKYERYFPEVSLFCVDEAHCMSQWAHSFRPSYLRLQSIIDLISPRSILAMTATAGPKVVDDICRTLSIDITPDANFSGVRVSKTNRDNIDVKCLFLNTQEERISKVCFAMKTKSVSRLQFSLQVSILRSSCRY
jgi:superfamily II DNA helicase RecQ